MRTDLKRYIEYIARNPFARWIAVYEDNVIGWAGPKYIEELDEVDLGYRFLPNYWGQGLATEACNAVITHCFGPLQITRLVALVKPDNVASVRVLEKTNFTFERDVQVFNTDAQQYALNRSD